MGAVPLMIPEVLKRVEADLYRNVETFRQKWSLEKVAGCFGMMAVDPPDQEVLASSELRRRIVRVTDLLVKGAETFPSEEQEQARYLVAGFYLTVGQEAKAEALLPALSETAAGGRMFRITAKGSLLHVPKLFPYLVLD